MLEGPFEADPVNAYDSLKKCQQYPSNPLDCVRELSLKGQELLTFPPELCCLRELRALDLSRNKFPRIPTGILLFRNLETLILDYNPLTSSEYESARKMLIEALPSLKNVRFLGILARISEKDEHKEDQTPDAAVEAKEHKT